MTKVRTTYGIEDYEVVWNRWAEVKGEWCEKHGIKRGTLPYYGEVDRVGWEMAIEPFIIKEDK